MGEYRYPTIEIEKPWEEITGSTGFAHVLDSIDSTGVIVRDKDLLSGFNAQPLLEGDTELRLRMWAVTTRWWFNNLVYTGEQQGVPIAHAILASLDPGSQPAIGVYNRSYFRRLNASDDPYGRYSLKRDREKGIEAALTTLILLPPTGASIAAAESMAS